jgi:hypothetical protein
MDEELRILHEAMVVKDRLRVLAELQATYWEELLARGFEAGIAEQLMLEWSRHAYGMTFRALPDPQLESDLDDLLRPADGAQPPRPARDGSDPSRVPPGEPWLQLVSDLDLEDLEDDGTADDRAA